jgi:dTDP-4-dehydrorhamnose 3,5-epimerase
MKITHTDLPGVLIIEPKVWEDTRGYFMESFRKDLLETALNHPVHFVQDNESCSTYGVLRGLHFQTPPHAQSKLVRVIQGSVLDVAVDIRHGSPTFGQHIAIELSAENRKQLFIPRGFAHGFVVLSDKAIFSYKVDAFYAPTHDKGLAFDDATLSINWQLPHDKLILSEKDRNHPYLKELPLYFDYQTNYYA